MSRGYKIGKLTTSVTTGSRTINNYKEYIDDFGFFFDTEIGRGYKKWYNVCDLADGAETKEEVSNFDEDFEEYE